MIFMVGLLVAFVPTDKIHLILMPESGLRLLSKIRHPTSLPVANLVPRSLANALLAKAALKFSKINCN